MAVGAALLANQFSSLVVFPFLAFMTADFFPDLHATQLGRYAGFLGGAFHMGALSGSVLWGAASDRYGRRPMMLLGICGTFVTILLFGLSKSFYMAVAMRFCWGFLNGNVGIAKAYLSEVCDESNQARGYSVIGLCAGIGRLLGPGVGAFFSRPAETLPMFDTPFWRHYPYFLPCCIGALMCAVSFALAYIYLEETVRPKPEASKPLLNNNDDVDTKKTRRGMLELITDRYAGPATLLYGLLAFANIAAQELFPLWSLTPPEDGGLAFSLQQIGTVILCAAPAQIMAQLMVFPPLSKRFGYRRLYGIMTIIIASVCLLVPQIHALMPHDSVVHTVWSESTPAPNATIHDSEPSNGLAANGAGNPAIQIVMVAILAFGTVQTCSTLAFTATFALVNNTVARKDRGLQNGIGQTYASLARSLGPVAAGAIYAWTASSGLGWPLNYSFCWYMISIMCVSCHLVSRRLPKKVDTKLYDD
ncbi:uncharacterized protein MONBRDRAFT_28003 [Monosiga brevicollis MX1]|uniref:Major facilitator superfamily (MFS) profile domain-containing protein n=1 Tax=Monosiga brevicollis TaxID=81824 RepID=A9V6X4_MONBE|nr:uncharacterized protein MONBRDRAFT_28003 [Monosiga brevicollis MX1]EDQ86692.1 predicted protein [Monosiga brevicollis MX1]|eukprot:XP_001748528.1 hypothetical protein [Monosiga brevicollis MX1]